MLCDILRAEYQAEVSLIERVTCSYYRTNQAASSATRCLEDNRTALNAGSLLGYFKDTSHTIIAPFQICMKIASFII